jgi:hypothetical protein
MIGVVDGVDEAGARLLGRVLDSEVEPDGAVEGHPLGHEDVGELVAERVAVLGRAEVARGVAPLADLPDDARDELLHAVLALRRSDVAAEVLGDDDVGRELGPRAGHLDVGLLEHRVALLVGDAGAAQLPLDGLEGVVPRPREVARDRQAPNPPGAPSPASHRAQRRAVSLSGLPGLDARLAFRADRIDHASPLISSERTDTSPPWLVPPFALADRGRVRFHRR